jgi:hypothetical protein
MDLKELDAIASRKMMKHELHGWTFGMANTKRGRSSVWDRGQIARPLMISEHLG